MRIIALLVPLVACCAARSPKILENRPETALEAGSEAPSLASNLEATVGVRLRVVMENGGIMNTVFHGTLVAPDIVVTADIADAFDLVGYMPGADILVREDLLDDEKPRRVIMRATIVDRGFGLVVLRTDAPLSQTPVTLASEEPELPLKAYHPRTTADGKAFTVGKVRVRNVVKDLNHRGEPSLSIDGHHGSEGSGFYDEDHRLVAVMSVGWWRATGMYFVPGEPPRQRRIGGLRVTPLMNLRLLLDRNGITYLLQ